MFFDDDRNPCESIRYLTMMIKSPINLYIFSMMIRIPKTIRILMNLVCFDGDSQKPYECICVVR